MSELIIPESWAEAEFENVITVQGGSQPPKSTFISEPREGYVRLVQIRDFRTDNHIVYIPIEKAKRSFTKEDIMIGRYGPPVFQILRGLEGSYNVALMKATPSMGYDKEFMYWYLQSPKIQLDINSVSQRSAGQTGVNLDFLNSYKVPLPPTKEQERIVKKIESCFEKIDESEQNLTQVETLLSKYRESLLAKAFRGELVEQDSNDEPASALLAKIREEREANQKGKKKKQEFAPISDDEKPFDIPERWEWVPLGELEVITGNTPKKVAGTDNDIPFYKPADFSFTGDIYVRDSEDSSSSNYKYREVKANSVVLVCIGATFGKSGIVTSDGAFNQQQNAVLPSQYILPEYLCYWFRSRDFQNILSKVNSSTTMPIVNKGQMEKLPFPLCSIEQQVKIVESLNNSFEKINTTFLDINNAKRIIGVTKESVLSKAFQGELVEQISSEGTGKELLEQILKEKENSKPVKKAKKRSK